MFQKASCHEAVPALVYIETWNNQDKEDAFKVRAQLGVCGGGLWYKLKSSVMKQGCDPSTEWPRQEDPKIQTAQKIYTLPQK